MKSFAISLLAPLAAAGIVTRQSASNWTVGQTVQTSSGSVIGHAARNASASSVSEYLGIPFAQAPTGDLRFAAPVAFEGTAAINASIYGYSCPVRPSRSAPLNLQALEAANITAAGPTVLAALQNTAGRYSEDCLNLNVWTKPQVGEAKKAVLVWLYGGAFSGGSSAIAAYNGANLVEEQDIIVVSINYRLGLLGWPGNPNATQNLGLLDQRLAIEWVRDNIEAFGGDPARITMFGQSAGGASIDFYAYAYAEDPIVAGIIPESGNAFGWALPNPTAFSAQFWFNATATLGCGNATSAPADVLACMRKPNATAILSAFPQLSGAAGILGGYGPTVDGVKVFANTSTRPAPKIPMLIGSTNYEVGLFRVQFALAGQFLSNAAWDFFNLQAFTCPTGARANASIAADVPTWRYRYFGVFPNLRISEQSGAFHVSEVPMLFNTAPNSPIPATTEQIAIGKYMRGAWAAFAKNPTSGLTNYGWPKYDPTQDTLVRIAYDNQTGANLINPKRYDADCSLVNLASTDETNIPTLPDAGANIKPTGTAGGGANQTGTGGSPTSTSTIVPANAAGRVEAGAWVVMGGVLMALLL